MGLFHKPEAEEKKLKYFWVWMRAHEMWMFDALTMDKQSVMQEVQRELDNALDVHKKPMKFDLVLSGNQGQFIFHHQGDKALKKDAERLQQLKPFNIIIQWTFIIEK